MLPRCLEVILLVKPGIGNNEVMFPAHVEKQQPISLVVTNSFLPNCVDFLISTDSGIEVSQQDNLVVPGDVTEDTVKL